MAKNKEGEYMVRVKRDKYGGFYIDSGSTMLRASTKSNKTTTEWTPASMRDRNAFGIQLMGNLVEEL